VKHWILLALIATSASAQEDDRYFYRGLPEPSPAIREYIERSAPFGIDFTRDGRIWVSLDPAGDRDDYSMLIEDILARNEWGATVWVRGFHKRNPDVKYRTSMARYSFDCKNKAMRTLFFATYDASGNVLSSFDGTGRRETIAPGTVGDDWWEVACRSAAATTP